MQAAGISRNISEVESCCSLKAVQPPKPPVFSWIVFWGRVPSSDPLSADDIEGSSIPGEGGEKVVSKN